MSDVYEWRRFEVGEHVRVRLSPECRSQFVVTHPTTGDRLSQSLIGHENQEDGAIGRVVEVARARVGKHGVLANGHYYEVDYDRLILTPTCWLAGARYAAAELEPLDAES